jgi:Acyl-coenzyme A synthetases/AMP-(fatty) acid ligases
MWLSFEIGIPRRSLLRVSGRAASAPGRGRMGKGFGPAHHRCDELLGVVHKIFANTLSARRAGSSGRPVPGVEVRLIDTDGSEITQSGRSGQLEVARLFSAPVIALTIRSHARPRIGRRRASAASGSPLAMNIFATRTVSITTAVRSDDMLKVSGLWVSPSEIEDMLAGIPTVREAAAV